MPGSFWIESLEGAEQVEYIWKDRIVCVANTSMKLDRLEETVIPESLIAMMADPEKRDALIDSSSLESGDESQKTSARERQELARLVEKYQAIPADRMIADLLNVVANTKGHEATIPAMLALRDWLLANPERSSEIAEALKKSDLPDGVTARLGEHHYLMTTTSGGVDGVVNWMEEWLQCEWLACRAYVTPVTTHWATLCDASGTGPR